MFGLKLKSWMEAHLGRPRHKSTSHQNQKRAPKDSSAVAATTSTTTPPSFASTSVVGAAASSCSASASSTTNSTSSSLNTSSSNGSTTTAIVGGVPISSSNTLTGIIASNSNSTVLDHLSSHHSDSQEANSNFQTRSDFLLSTVTTSSSTPISSSAVIGGGGGGSQVVGSESVTVSAEGQLHRAEKSNCAPPQNRDAIGTRVSELGSHAPSTHQIAEHPGESDHPHQQPISSVNPTAAVTGSVSNSTSILSGSFCNNLSSPDTGYSTDGYSPKSVYPALSFDSTGKSTTTSKSSYTISSLVSSELHSSKQTSLSSASCSVQNGLDEYASASPSSPALTSSTPFSQSSSSGISSNTSDSSCFPKGQVHGESSLRLIQQKHQQHSIPEDDTEKQQVIMGDESGTKTIFTEQETKKSLEKLLHPQVEVQQKHMKQQQKSGSKTDISITTIDPLPKFAPINIDFETQDFTNHNGRTHRRAESMDARTPSHEDYKPLVPDEESSIAGSGGNPSLVMTAAQAKSIRTSYIINSSGQIVEFSSFKNAYSICSPRRERTRIKTNPWIILSNNKTGNNSDNNSNVNPSTAIAATTKGDIDKKQMDINTCAPSKTLIPPGESSISQKVETRKQEQQHKVSIQTGKVMGESAKADVVDDYTSCKIEKGGKSSIGNHTAGVSIDPCRKLNLEINNRQEPDIEDEEEHFEDETGIIGSSSSLLYRISTSASASDSGKGTLEPGTNRNSTESSCLLSDSTASTRNSIISHEAERSSSRSGRSSSGESISSSLHHHHHRDHHPVDDDTLGHASPTSSSNNASPALLFTESQKQHQQQQQQQPIHQCTTATVNSNNSVSKASFSGGKPCVASEERTFRNAAVATDLLTCETSFPKSASVSVGVGTTSSNKSAKFQPIMVDKETDILSDWANTDEDGDEEIETDRNDNETVTPAPSSPGTDVDRAFFSQSTSSATDIDFGDSSAATAASSTAVFPPSSLIRQQRYNNNNSSHKNSRESGSGGTSARFHNESSITSNGFNGGGDVASQILPGTYDHHHHHNINMNSSATCYPSVPIIRPVLAAASQHHGPNGIPDSYAYDIGGGGPVLLNHAGELLVNHPFSPPSEPAMCFTSGGGVPNFNLDDDEGDYPEMKGSHHHHSKGIARGALGFLRKIFKKGACSSQRHSPDSTKGKKSRGKSDNNLAAVGLGSPLLTISEPLCNPRYSAVLTTKKQMNAGLPAYFLTPTPNSFRRRSGTGTDSSDSKGSKPHTKSVKTDIIRVPQGALSPQQQQSLHQQRQTHVQSTSSSHSSGSSSSHGVSNGIPQSCSTFLSPCGGAPGTINFHQLNLPGAGSNLASQSNTNTNTNSTSSSIHSLMSTSTSAASVSGNGNQNRPPSQNQSKTPIPPGQDSYYVNSSPTSRQSPFISTARGNSHSMSPPPLISEHSPYLNGIKNQQQHSFQSQSQVLQHQQQSQHRRDPHSQSPSIKGILPYEPPRLPNTSAATSAAQAAAAAAAAAKMNSPSFNNYSPIHRLVVTGGSHLLNRSNPNCPSNNPSVVNPSSGLMQYPPSGESPLPMLRHGGANSCGTNNGNGTGNNNNNPAGFVTNSQIINRPSHPTSSASPLINHRYPTTSSPHPAHLPYPSPMSSSHVQQQHNQHHQNLPTSSVGHHFFASPSPILRNPRYQYIASSNQNSPILNVSKRMNTVSSSHIIQPNVGNGPASNPSGPPPLLTTFSPLPSSSSAASALGAPRESLINNNSFLNKTNTITGSPNLNSSDPFNQRARQAVSTSLSYNEFENLSKNYHLHNNGNSHLPLSSAAPPYNHPHHHILSHPPQQPQPQHLLHQSQKSRIHQNHYYSSPIVKELQQHPDSLKQTFWNNTQLFNNSQPTGNEARQQQRMNQNLRFNSFLVRHRQLPQFYHTQWGLQERIYETVDSEDEHSPSDEVSAGGVDYDQDGNEIDRISELSLPVEVHRRMKHCYSREMVEEASQQNCDAGFHLERESSRNHANKEFGDGQTNGMMSYTGDEGVAECAENAENFQQTSKSKSRRSKPKSLSASGRPLPRGVVALPMMPGTYLSETETRLLEADKETDRKYKRLINEAEALLKEISVEKSKRTGTQDNAFRLEGCPQSDPLRRKAYDCWALRRLQQELAGCCASPPVLHRSRLNLQSPSTPTVSNNPYLSHFQSMAAPPLPHQVPYMSSSGVDGNQNTFEL
ncbi:unnamed protein product [Orchesella dallaii]|uniref:Uncharacterized protein n=1 Tax=Orchesella dallaii TaxID=48710 RepID=A0ABP1S5V2_9HEXA